VYLLQWLSAKEQSDITDLTVSQVYIADWECLKLSNICILHHGVLYMYLSNVKDSQCKHDMYLCCSSKWNRQFRQYMNHFTRSSGTASSVIDPVSMSFGTIVTVIGRDSRKSRQHGNHRNHDFRQMPWLCQNTVFLTKMPCFLCFYNNILFLHSVSWSLLRDFNTKMCYLCLCYQSQCALLPWRHRRNMYFTFSGVS